MPMIAPTKSGLRRVLKSDKRAQTRVSVGGQFEVGDGFCVIAGPCAVESAAQVDEAASAVKSAGAHALRGGVFKPRTSPYSFQGLGEVGVRAISDAGKKHRLPIVSEVMDASQLADLVDHVDVLQIGARNMQNFSLLKEVALAGKPILLKRGISATLDEWLLAAEYLLDGGTDDVILCERGIRTFEPAMRNTLDLAGVAYLKARTHLPVLVDPSHSTGERALVIPMALAAAAAGADGILVEVHPRPDEALCDGPQALTPDMFAELMTRLAPLLQAVGSHFSGTSMGQVATLRAAP